LSLLKRTDFGYQAFGLLGCRSCQLAESRFKNFQNRGKIFLLPRALRKIVPLLFPETAPAIWQRGEESRRQVLLCERMIFGWRAEVASSRSLQTHEANFFLGEAPENFSAECSCGHFEITGEICKHLVAAALTIDAATEGGGERESLL
jgi:hypothetical protein